MSRRKFLRKTVTGARATAAVAVAGQTAQGAEAAVTIPAGFAAASSTAPRRLESR
jgi:hypothetical protein